ncbi:hypothetical protein L0222_24250 [bacterium]|nr:hypothetical protein [bacterium]
MKIHRHPNLRRLTGRQPQAAALKIIRTEHPDLAIRFVHEARAQARVQHEHVCQVYEVGEMDGKQYIAMQRTEWKESKRRLRI